MRGWRSAHQPTAIATKVRKNPTVAEMFRIVRMSIFRSRMMNGPASPAAEAVTPVTRLRKTVAATGRVP